MAINERKQTGRMNGVGKDILNQTCVSSEKSKMIERKERNEQEILMGLPSVGRRRKLVRSKVHIQWVVTSYFIVVRLF